MDNQYPLNQCVCCDRPAIAICAARGNLPVCYEHFLGDDKDNQRAYLLSLESRISTLEKQIEKTNATLIQVFDRIL